MATNERREREKQMRRAAILDAARALFNDKGFRDTTIDDIARATELARGTVYLYFESKEEIYATVLEEGLEILFTLIRDAHDSTPNPLEKVLNGHGAFLTFHDRYPQYYTVLLLNQTEIEDQVPTPVKKRIEGRLAELARYIAAELEAGIGVGAFRPVPPLETAYIQMAVAIGFSMMLDRCIRPGVDVDRSTMIGLMRDVIIRGLTAVADSTKCET